LSESEPVAASNHAFVLKFKYEIHCKMASENNNNVKDNLEYLLYEMTGRKLEMVGVPESEWGRIREEFLQDHRPTEEAKQETEDPLIAEAKKLVGEDLIEINE
jgi:DNA polymerase III subunit gamma/tau